VTIYILSQALIPFHRLFSPQDPLIKYPHALNERVPIFWLMIISVAVPAGCIAVYCILTRSALQKLHVSLLGLGLSLMLTEALTNVIKNGVGRPRPDLLARCVLSAEDATLNQLLSVDKCTQTDLHILHDGWRSFPSGHSSFAFSGLGFLSLFLTGQLHVLRGGFHTDFFRAIICLFPLVVAMFVAISRLEDYRHAPEDVLVGSALGFVVTWATYRRFFPSLFNRGCSVPFPSLDENGTLGLRAKRDVEMGRQDDFAFELDDVVSEDGDASERPNGSRAEDEGRGRHVPLRSTEL
jgi:diacylglycerol diphosphate phosphatase/phosphatidate phosphatase